MGVVGLLVGGEEVLTKGAGRKYLVELGGAMAAYGVVLVAVLLVLNNLGEESAWRVPLALLPMIPIVLVFVAFLRYLDRMDELQRRIEMEALSFGFGGTALLTFEYGFLQIVGFPQVSWFLVWPIMAVLWMVGKARAVRRYS